jgi:predicted nucleotidyltransferase
MPGRMFVPVRKRNGLVDTKRLAIEGHNLRATRQGLLRLLLITAECHGLHPLHQQAAPRATNDRSVGRCACASHHTRTHIY